MSASPKRATCVEVEAGEGAAEILALAQDRQPGEAGLKALEAELLEQAAVVGDRPAPFVVVIGRDSRHGRAPPAARPAVVARDQSVSASCIIRPCSMLLSIRLGAPPATAGALTRSLTMSAFHDRTFDHSVPGRASGLISSQDAVRLAASACRRHRARTSSETRRIETWPVAPAACSRSPVAQTPCTEYVHAKPHPHRRRRGGCRRPAPPCQRPLVPRPPVAAQPRPCREPWLLQYAPGKKRPVVSQRTLHQPVRADGRLQHHAGFRYRQQPRTAKQRPPVRSGLPAGGRRL